MESTGKVIIKKEFLICEDLGKIIYGEFNEGVEISKEELDRAKLDIAENPSQKFLICVKIVTSDVNFYCEIGGEENSD